jgi:hypothetical protein
MMPSYRYLRSGILITFGLVCAVALLAQLEPVAVNLGKYMGKPSKPEMDYGSRSAQRSQAKYARKEQGAQTRALVQREKAALQLASLTTLRSKFEQKPDPGRVQEAASKRKMVARQAKQNESRRHQIAAALKQKAQRRRQLASLAKRNKSAAARLAKAEAENKKLQLALKQADDEKKRLEQQLAQADRTERDSQQIAQGASMVYQTLSYAFVSPKQQPVANLRVVAVVKTTDGKEQKIPKTTDGNGRIRLEKLGPLPVSVDVAMEAQPDTEWRVREPEKVCMVIDRPRGERRVARSRPRSSAVQLASLSPGVPMMTPQEKGVLHEDLEPHRIEVERTVVDLDVVAPPGSRVVVSLPQAQPQTVPDAGRLSLKLPVAALLESPIPLLVSADLPGGEAETVLSVYPHDPYAKNEIRVAGSDLRIARLSKLELPQSLGVLASQEQVTEAFKPLRKRPKVMKLSDGSEWWKFDDPGVWYKLRPLPSLQAGGKRAPVVVERIRLISAQAGSVGGVTVGSPAEEVDKALGTAQNPNDKRVISPEDAAAGAVDAYMDRGLRVCRVDGKVKWLEVARPTPLLTAGTTAFTPRHPTRLYVRRFQGHKGILLEKLEDLKAYLRQTNAVTLVDNEEDADLILEARVTDFTGKKEAALGIMPYKYSCTTRLAYSLYEPGGKPIQDSDGSPIDNKTVEESTTADYSRDALLVAIIPIFSEGIVKSDLLKWALRIYGVAKLIRTLDSVSRAVNRCPTISARQAFGHMISDINRASDFLAGVTDVDYASGQVVLNVGSTNGVRVNKEDQPSEFELFIDGNPLPVKESKDRGEYYSAVVTEVREHECVCEIQKVTREVRGSVEIVKGKVDPAYLKMLLDPATGLVTARAGVRLPPVQIAPDGERAWRELTRSAKAENVRPGAKVAHATLREARGAAGSFRFPVGGSTALGVRELAPALPLGRLTAPSVCQPTVVSRLSESGGEPPHSKRRKRKDPDGAARVPDRARSARSAARRVRHQGKARLV